MKRTRLKVCDCSVIKILICACMRMMEGRSNVSNVSKTGCLVYSKYDYHYTYCNILSLSNYVATSTARDRETVTGVRHCAYAFFAPSWVACAVHPSKMPRDTTEIISSIPESEGASQLCSKFLWARVRGVNFSHMWMAARLLSSFVRVWSAQEIISVWSGYKYDYFSRKKSQLDHIQCLSLYTKVGNYN